MFDRLLAMNYIDTADLPANSHWQARCAGRLARCIASEYYFTLGILITPPNERSWLRQATLVLAACEQGRDCALEQRGEEWILWSYYPNELDDKELKTSVQLQLALVHYLERDMLKSTLVTKPRLWRKKL
ncbi:hypothetical protein GTG28_04955 [Vibrio sp. OCN044]|uniref:Uncharacterized protein n=1 Tax=Vibrio tetraodonis subsp. pristinus TaxID=2695891 RepID=A0A6L8LR57_9VIBR|nr:hypothetical protein [Vibrio tetraodonis]MYM58567.1 hypothetical protein [Vibrio tetraodonis subsp. pristinus]